MNIQVIETLSEPQIMELAKLYKQEGWTKDRTLEDIKKMIKHCKIIGLIDEETDRLVGFTRIVTDYIYRATIYDVIVLKEYQGLGLGRLLMETIVNHPILSKIERVDLYCAEEKIEFYKKWGFNKVAETTNYLKRTNQ
jgi:ribosomal protein S18 acetylase RimI-like enzyme